MLCILNVSITDRMCANQLNAWEPKSERSDKSCFVHYFIYQVSRRNCYFFVVNGRCVKLIFTEGHISIMVALKGSVVTVWLSSKG